MPESRPPFLQGQYSIGQRSESEAYKSPGVAPDQIRSWWGQGNGGHKCLRGALRVVRLRLRLR